MSLTALAFAASYLSGLLLALFRNPLYGLYTYIAVFYLHPPARWWGMDLPDMRWSLLAGIVTFIGTLRAEAPADRDSWFGSRGVRILALFVVWFWIQSLWALDGPVHREAAALFTKYLVLFYLIYRLVQDEQTLQRVMLAHMLGCLYLGWLALLAPPWGRLEGVGGPAIDSANALAMQLNVGLIFSSVILFRGSKAAKILAIIAVPLIVNGIVQTESRGAVVGLFAAGGVMMYLSPPKFRRWFVVAGVAGLIVLVQIAPQNFLERIGTITSAVEKPEEMDTSSSGRLVLIEAQWQMFLAHPLGVGHRGTAVLSPMYLDESQLAADTRVDGSKGRRSSHNTLMTVLVEQGIPGMLLFIPLVWWAFRSLQRIRQADPKFESGFATYQAAVGGALASVLASGMFADYLKMEIFYWNLTLVAVLADITARYHAAAAPAPDDEPVPAVQQVPKPAPRG